MVATNEYIQYLLDNIDVLVDEVTDWEVKCVCRCCGSTHYSPNARKTTISSYTKEAHEIAANKRCWDCGYSGSKVSEIKPSDNFKVSPMDTKVIRSRRLYLESQKRHWWGGKKKRKYVTQIEELPYPDENE